MSERLRASLAPRRTIIAAIAALAALVLTVPMMVQGAHTGATEIEIDCGPETVNHGTAVVCTVTVEDVSAEAEDRAAPIGPVTVHVNGTDHACSALVPDAADPLSTCTVTLEDLEIGTHQISATYGPHEEDGHSWLASETAVDATVTVVGGTIIIEKESLGGVGTFDLSILEDEVDAVPAGFTLATTEPGADGVASITFLDLLPGEFSVTEETENGWALTAIACNPEDDADVNLGTRSVTIDVAAGETVTCRFVNTQNGSLTITKSATPAGTFEFVSSANLGVTDNTFSINTSVATSTTLSGLQPDTYTVTEVVPAGWELTNISCTGAAQSVVTIGGTEAFVAGDVSVSVALAAGEQVNCTFTNTSEGTITISKVSQDGTGAFPFTSNLPGGNFSLTTTTAGTAVSHAVAGLQVDTTYVIAELVPEDWTLTNIQCSGTNATVLIGGTGAFVGGDTAVSIMLTAAGGSAVCIFTNTADEADEEPEVVEGCPGPAAPGVASAHLRAGGYFAGGPGRGNIVAAVAQEMGEGATFQGISKCDREAYEAAVRSFVDDLIDEQGLEPGVQTRPQQAQGSGRPADVPRGNPFRD